MADKYLIHGATYYGDGTSSAEATSNGGVGAWNNINILTGTTPTYGSLAAGDTVHIRSKTSAGADITVSYGTNTSIGKSGLTGTQYVKWKLDQGSVWSGITGTLTFTATASVTATLLDNNSISGGVRAGIVFNVSGVATSSAVMLNINGGSLAEFCKFDNSSVTTHGPKVQGNTSGESTLAMCDWYSAFRYQSLISVGNYGLLNIIDPDIEITSPAETDPVFATGSYGSAVRVFGGRLHGAGVFSGLALMAQATSGVGTLELIGFKYDKSLVISSSSSTASTPIRATSVGSDAAMGSRCMDWSVLVDSTDYINLPYLNAATPGASPVSWSCKVAPSSYAGPARTCRIAPIAKMYEDAAAAIDITMEMLVESSFTEIDKSTAYLLVSYIDDSTGDPACVSSKGSGALDSSTAAWSATTYGAESFDKRSITVTTPTSVKQYTPVFIQLIIESGASISTKYLIVCPDVQFS